VLVCCERKLLLADWWLVLVWCEKKILLVGWRSSQQNRVYASFQSSVYAIYFLLITMLKFMVDPLQQADVILKAPLLGNG